MSKCLLSVLLLVLCSVSLGAQSSSTSASEDLANLWNQYDTISTELSDLLQMQGTNLDELLLTVQTLTTELESLKADLAQWRSELTELHNLSQTLAEESRRLQISMDELLTSLNSLEQRYSGLESQLLILNTRQTATTIGAIVGAVVLTVLIIVFNIQGN